MVELRQRSPGADWERRKEAKWVADNPRGWPQVAEEVRKEKKRRAEETKQRTKALRARAQEEGNGHTGGLASGGGA